MNKFETVMSKKFPEIETKLPVRSTSRSAGYDFFSKQNYRLIPGEYHKFYTDVKIQLDSTNFLMLITRSGNGANKGLKIRNQVGIIDADYYNNSDNDGNIIICLENDSPEVININVGDKIAQGIITNFLVSSHGGECLYKNREGGLGSTDEN